MSKNGSLEPTRHAQPGTRTEKTRARILDAAALVFATSGYDGSTVDEVAVAAGVSKPSVYAYFPSKAQLFVAVVRQHARRDFELLGCLEEQRRSRDEFAMLRSGLTATLRRADPIRAALTTKVIVTCRRQPEVAELVRDWLREGEMQVSRAIDGAGAQTSSDAPSSDVVARFVTLIALGSRAAEALDLPDVDDEDWVSLISWITAAIKKRQSAGVAVTPR